MDEPLKRLLASETRAQARIDEAERQRQAMIDEALAAVREAEAQFESERVARRAPFLEEAQQRAEQAAAELSQKYAEHQRTLRALAAKHEREAVEAALALLLDPSR